MTIFSTYHRLPLKPQTSKVIEWSLDFRRASIFFRRAKRVGDYDVKIFGTFSPDTRDHSIITPFREELENTKNKVILGENSPNTSVHSKFMTNKGGNYEDYVAIIDLDAKGRDNQYEVIRLPFIPKELSYDCESAFATIQPMGRNNPIYHFTGAEDRLSFEIDWYAFDWGRRQVIENCRKIESLSKADGYNGTPHRVKLMWGKENVLFSDHEFIVISAPYKLSNFNKSNIDSNGTVDPTHMLPIQAYQNITLGRITRDNLPKVQIEYVGNASPKAIFPELVSPKIYNLM